MLFCLLKHKAPPPKNVGYSSSSGAFPKHKDILHHTYICYSTYVVLCPKIVDINFFDTRARPLTMPPHCLLSHRRLPSTYDSASHCTTASRCAPLTPLVWLVVTSLLVTPPLPICLCLHLSSHPSHPSCPAGCRVTSYHTTTTSRCLHLCLTLCHCLSLRPSCTSFLAGCYVTSHLVALSHLPALCLSLHHCLSPCPSWASCLAGCCFASCCTAASYQPAPLPLRALPSSGSVGF